jgi:hypothetical protein
VPHEQAVYEICSQSNGAISGLSAFLAQPDNNPILNPSIGLGLFELYVMSLWFRCWAQYELKSRFINSEQEKKAINITTKEEISRLPAVWDLVYTLLYKATERLASKIEEFKGAFEEQPVGLTKFIYGFIKPRASEGFAYRFKFNDKYITAKTINGHWEIGTLPSSMGGGLRLHSPSYDERDKALK